MNTYKKSFSMIFICWNIYITSMRLLYEEGYTIGGARQRLTSEDGPSPVELVAAIRDSLRDLEQARGLLICDSE